jgi:hypothetical protein
VAKVFTEKAWPSWTQNPGQIQANLDAHTIIVEVTLATGAYNTLPDPRTSGDLLVLLFVKSSVGTETMTFGANFPTSQPITYTGPMLFAIILMCVIKDDGLAYEVSRQQWPVPVLYGGTGVTGFTNHGVLFGDSLYGSQRVMSTAEGATGELLVGNTGAPPSWTNVLPGLVLPVTVTSSTPYAVTSTDINICVNAAGGAKVVNLPVANGTRRVLNIKKVDTSMNIVTVTADVTGTPDLIDGDATKELTVPWTSITLQDAAVNTWYVL